MTTSEEQEIGKWAIDHDDLFEWDDVVEQALEHIGERDYVVAVEYRPAVLNDISPSEITFGVWDYLWRRLREHDTLAMSTYDGPELDAPDIRSNAWEGLHDAIVHVLTDHLDMTDAAEQRTGRARQIYPDGSWEEVTQ